MKFSENHLWLVFYTYKKFRFYSNDTYFVKTFCLFHENQRFFGENQEFGKSIQSISMKFSEKHAVIVFYTLRKFRCFSYHTLIFRSFSSFHEIRRTSFCKNHNFDKSTQSISMKFSEKHAVIVFYTLRKFRCFSYHALIFRTFSSFREIRRISFCKNHNFDKSTQSIFMKFSEKHAMILFYTLRKFRCFSYHTLFFRAFSLFSEIRRISL
jgi:hypothetical protein